jgi:malate dehydrogenase (quinone)
MTDLVDRCFKEQLATPEWQQKMKIMIPSYGQTLNDKPELLSEIRKYGNGFISNNK